MMETPLIDPSSVGIPAPLWFVQFFKWFGFTLHAVPMNLWYAGLLAALWLHLRGNPNARIFGGRLLKQMPIIIALGINFGIVPLLFIQLAYHKVFYPATILMAWFWFGIICLLIPAYYGVYAYVWGLRNGGGNSGSLAGWRVAAGWCASLFFITIGFLFANGLSLMEHVQRWEWLWREHNVAGAATGTALNVGDPALWPRWLLMFGLALGTTSAWLVVDAVFLAGKTVDAAYRSWAVGFAKKLYTFAMLWTAAAGAWYVFGTWPPELYDAMFRWPTVLLTLATGGAMGLPWLLLMAMRRDAPNPLLAVFFGLGQFGVLGINALSRQLAQNIHLKRFFDVFDQVETVQWSPLAMFLIAFVLGLGVVGWMLLQPRNSRIEHLK